MPDGAEPMGQGTTKEHRIDRDKLADMLTRYYHLRGWDDDGVMAPEREREITGMTVGAEPPKQI